MAAEVLFTNGIQQVIVMPERHISVWKLKTKVDCWPIADLLHR
jgi:hypothetical protein